MTNPADIIESAFGVPSRMNLGQIYETVLASTGQKLGLKFSADFDGATIDEINHYTDEAGATLRQNIPD